MMLKYAYKHYIGVPQLFDVSLVTMAKCAHIYLPHIHIHIYIYTILVNIILVFTLPKKFTKKFRLIIGEKLWSLIKKKTKGQSVKGR